MLSCAAKFNLEDHMANLQDHMANLQNHMAIQAKRTIYLRLYLWSLEAKKNQLQIHKEVNVNIYQIK